MNSKLFSIDFAETLFAMWESAGNVVNVKTNSSPKNAEQKIVDGNIENRNPNGRKKLEIFEERRQINGTMCISLSGQSVGWQTKFDIIASNDSPLSSPRDRKAYVCLASTPIQNNGKSQMQPIKKAIASTAKNISASYIYKSLDELITDDERMMICSPKDNCAEIKNEEPERFTSVHIAETDLNDLMQKGQVYFSQGKMYFKNDSTDIQLMLKSDPNFVLIRNDFGPILTEIEKKSLVTLETIVGTLEQMKFPFSFDFLNRMTANLRFQTDAGKLGSIKIFAKLIGLIGDETSVGFMQRIYEALMQSGDGGNECLFKWCIEKWHLGTKNKHRDLVEKLLRHPNLGFDYFIMFGLHSDISSIPAERGLNSYYRKLISCLLQVDIANKTLIDEVTNILLPKLDMASFEETFRIIRNENCAKPDIGKKMTPAEWLDGLKLREKVQIEPLQNANVIKPKKIVAENQSLDSNPGEKAIEDVHLTPDANAIEILNTEKAETATDGLKMKSLLPVKIKSHNTRSKSLKKADKYGAIQRTINVKSIKVGDTAFYVGEIILAKYSRWPHWPCFIKEIYGVDESKLTILVEYFGKAHRTESKVSHGNILKYGPNRPLIEAKKDTIKNLTERAQYIRAVAETDLLIANQCRKFRNTFVFRGLQDLI